MRRSLFLILIAIASTSAHAQIVRQRYGVTQPSAWVSGSAGLQQGWTVNTKDGQWVFGDATQYGASLEKALSNGMSIGVRGVTATVPVRVTQAAVAGDGDATVSQLFGTFHGASGGAFHTVFELSAGATLYSNFTKGAAIQGGSAEPATISLLGLTGMGLLARRRRSAK